MKKIFCLALLGVMSLSLSHAMKQSVKIVEYEESLEALGHVDGNLQNAFQSLMLANAKKALEYLSHYLGFEMTQETDILPYLEIIAFKNGDSKLHLFLAYVYLSRLAGTFQKKKLDSTCLYKSYKQSYANNEEQYAQFALQKAITHCCEAKKK